MTPGAPIDIVSCHAEGEVGDVIVSGVDPPPGDTLWEQSRWIANDGRLRAFVLNEPRGGVFRHVNLLVPAKNPKAQMGWIIMEPEDTPPMSGSNSMCVATVLLETNILPMTEPVTRLTLEAPGGLVEVEARCRERRVESVAVRNVPSFHDQLDVTIEVEGLGTLTADTAYGGDTFVIVDAQQLGFEVAPDEAADIARIGVQVTRAANEQVGFRHPDNADWDHFSFCMLTAPLRRENCILLGRSAVSIQPGKLDRSPCGTGCSARMAILYERGLLKNGDAFIGESIIGSRFDCTVDGLTKTDSGRSAIIPRLRGRAWITGRYQHRLDPDDPWPAGYRVADTWPVFR